MQVSTQMRQQSLADSYTCGVAKDSKRAWRIPIQVSTQMRQQSLADSYTCGVAKDSKRAWRIFYTSFNTNAPAELGGFLYMWRRQRRQQGLADSYTFGFTKRASAELGGFLGTAIHVVSK
jgi:hypothetical protein